MMTSLPSRRVLLVLLVVVGGLLVVTLYKMDTFTTYFRQQQQQQQHQPHSWTHIKPLDAQQETTTQPAVLLKTREEQVQAGNTLYQLMIKEPTTYSCQSTKYIKNEREGAWTFCTDRPFALKKPCLVYSFGIDYDFTFDDALGDLGCEVFSFDPSMNTTDHRRNPHVMFYQIGLGGYDTDSFKAKGSIYNKQGAIWKMRTLKTLTETLGHSQRTIDILKVDVESSEWSAVRNMLETRVLKNVKQFLLEWHIFPKHPPRESFSQLIATIRDLQEAGFKAFDKHPHPVTLDWEKFNLQSDIGYVNVNFTKS